MKKIIVSLIILFITTSCLDSFLDISPDGRLSMDDVWKDPIKTEAYLGRAYSSIPSYFDTYGFFELLAAATDEAIYRNRSRATSLWSSGNLTPASNGLNPFYNNYWNGIRDCNVFINNIDHSAIESSTLRDRLKAEAKILRSYYYFELIKQYGPMPIISEELLIDYDFQTLTRPTFQTNVDFIIEDLNSAISESNLPIRYIDGNDRGRMSKAVAYALKSEVLLYNASPLWNPGNNIEKWESASKASKEALNVLQENGYGLFPNYEQYYLHQSDLRDNPNDIQTIYETRRDASYNYHLVLQNNIPSKIGTASSGVSPTQELVDSYNIKSTGEMPILGYHDNDHLNPIINPQSGYDQNNPYDDRDPRFYASIWFNGAKYDNIDGVIHTVETFVGGKDGIESIEKEAETPTVTGYYLRKFIDSKIQMGQSADSSWKKYHLAKIFLNFAEAENEANGPTVEAYEAINSIRRRVYMPDLPLNLTKEQFRERLRNERQVELAFEEDRFWDVRRWKIMSATDKVVTGMEIHKNGNNNFDYKRILIERRNTWHDRYLIFPIPLGETSKIPDFNENQNPGW
jgi:hypothetical protein